MGQEKERREKWWCVYFIFSHFPSFSGKDENGWNHYGTTLEKMVARTCSTKQMSNQKQRNLEEKINKKSFKVETFTEQMGLEFRWWWWWWWWNGMEWDSEEKLCLVHSIIANQTRSRKESKVFYKERKHGCFFFFFLCSFFSNLMFVLCLVPIFFTWGQNCLRLWKRR